MVTKPGARDLVARFGEVPSAGSDARRAWLVALTDEQLRSIIRAHGDTAPSPFADCWGWGATASGLDEGDPVPRCAQCKKSTTAPLWFTDGALVWARCWRCAAVDHLTDCVEWAIP